MTHPASVPKLHAFGLDGLLVQFAQVMDRRANQAALHFAAALRQSDLPVHDVASTLVSVTMRFEPSRQALEDLRAGVDDLLASRDWFATSAESPARHWRVPTLYGGAAGPQLEEAAAMAGMSASQAIEALGSARVSVLTLGFAPGQPYLGELPPVWDLPRQTSLTPRVPAGALVLAIRQLVVFANASPTGWRQIGLTAMPLFDPQRNPPALLAPSDEVTFTPVSADDFAAAQRLPLNGLFCENRA